MKNISIIMAMEAEASQLINNLNFIKVDSPEPRLSLEVFQASYKDLNISLVLHGKDKVHKVDSIGPQVSTLATYLTIQNFSPEFLINAGTCGGFMSKGSSIAKVYLCNEFCSHDGRVSIPGFDSFSVNHTKFKHEYVKKIQRTSLLEHAVVSTGNSLDICDEDFVRINKHYRVVKEMEASAIAFVAKQFDVPFMALKSVTDLIDGGELPQDEFLVNLKKSSEQLTIEITNLLDIVNDL